MDKYQQMFKDNYLNHNARLERGCNNLVSEIDESFKNNLTYGRTSFSYVPRTIHRSEAIMSCAVNKINNSSNHMNAYIDTTTADDDNDFYTEHYIDITYKK